MMLQPYWISGSIFNYRLRTLRTSAMEYRTRAADDTLLEMIQRHKKEQEIKQRNSDNFTVPYFDTRKDYCPVRWALVLQCNQKEELEVVKMD